MRKLSIILASSTLLFQPAEAMARNIVLTNDDGLTSNVVALYHALKKQGHDVIVSVPCVNQSGMGAALNIARPLAPLTEPCLNNAAKAGEAGAGQMSRADLPTEDFHYVAGTPVMALLYGLDVAGQKRWGKEPDLVLSGPNEGQNVGAIILSSGTVSNAQYATIRGIPAIALSAGQNTTGDEKLANPLSKKAATLSVNLVDILDKQSKGGRILPSGIALNVNFPDDMEGAKWQFSKIGSYNAYKLTFVENIAKSASPTMVAMAKQHGMQLPELPGLSFGMNEAEPKENQQNDESIVYRKAIAISLMQAGYEANSSDTEAAAQTLRQTLSALD